VELEQTTVLTGMNNTGKTSFLKALQIASGHPYRKMAVHQNEKWFYCLYLP
jgi:predicted ATP-dependent endonuclease of OLD family